MEYVIGIASALGVGVFADVIGFGRERGFYPVVLIVIAFLYILFAAMAGSTEALLAEVLPALTFVAAAAIGYRKSAWIVVAGLALHGIFDFLHHHLISNPGVPAWWPGFCLAYDVTAAVFLGVLITTRSESRPS